MLFSTVLDSKPKVSYEVSLAQEVVLNCHNSGLLITHYEDQEVNTSAPLITACNNFGNDSYNLPIKKLLDNSSEFNILSLSTYLKYKADYTSSINDFLNNKEFKVTLYNMERSYPHDDISKKSHLKFSNEIINFKNFKIYVLSPELNHSNNRKEIVLFKANDISYLEAIEKLSAFKDVTIHFTNNYDFTSKIECIEGDMWAKEYGKKIDKDCAWIPIKATIENLKGKQ
jgi:hypothetical protein